MLNLIYLSFFYHCRYSYQRGYVKTKFKLILFRSIYTVFKFNLFIRRVFEKKFIHDQQRNKEKIRQQQKND